MQEVIGSNPLSSTQVVKGTDSEYNPSLSTLDSANSPSKLPIDMLTINNAIGMSKNYTTPTLNKGKAVTSVPRGSTKIKEQAKQEWYVDFSFLNPNTGRMQRFRKTHDGNRIKDPADKLSHFTQLVQAYTDLLESGYNPIDEFSNAKLKKSVVSATLEEAKELFVQYHNNKGTRKKTTDGYVSKLKLFIEFHGSGKKVNDITDYEITTFLNHHEAKSKWSGTTYVNARTALHNFFKYLVLNKYVPMNPVTLTETRRKIKTETHQVFNDNDFKRIMAWLKENDSYMLLFCRTLYYTCIRPKELRYMQLKHIDFKSNTITIPANIAKNKKALPVNIDPSLKEELIKLRLDSCNQDWYLFGSTKHFMSKKHIGENTPYYRFQQCLKKLELLNKNYTLYSFKHLSNVTKFKAGWTIAEICAANRHSSLVETETYLKDLLKEVKTDKVIPPI